MGRAMRRCEGPLLVACLIAGLAMAPASARAETRREYVNRYVLLVDWVNRSEIWVTQHLEDPGLCRLAHTIALEHVEIARRMTPPPEFVAIHPHLLLIMENTERMFDSAAAGNRPAYHRYRRVIHDEQQLISELLQAEGILMPDIVP
jgi:hypothetical protein